MQRFAIGAVIIANAIVVMYAMWVLAPREDRNFLLFLYAMIIAAAASGLHNL